MNLAVVGELKGTRAGKDKSFTLEEIGIMYSFLVDLLEYQPQRTEATGFLCDGRMIQFFRIVLESNHFSNLPQYRLDETPVFLLGEEGYSLLIGLLSTDVSDLGLQGELTAKKLPVIPTEVLGVGGSSVVYKAQWKEETVVLKSFRGDFVELLLKEKENLELVRHIDQRQIPSFLAVTDDGKSLILTPIGQHFAICAEDYQNQNKIHAGRFDLKQRTVAISLLCWTF